MIIESEGGDRKSRRAATRKYIEWAAAELEMSTADIARLTGYAPSTIADYRIGRRLPSLTFLLDLADKIPLADPEFKLIEPLLGLTRSGVPAPSRYLRRPLSTYLAAVRVASRRTRDQFAAKMGVNAVRVQDMEHGLLPDRDYLLRMARTFLPSTANVDEIIAVFPVLRPTAYELKIQNDLKVIRLQPVAEPQRLRLENALATELIPVAKRVAANAAWKMNRPEYAQEVWGEGLALAIQNQDPTRGLFFSYLKSCIAGLLNAFARGSLQSGTETILHDYGTAVREAEESLRDQLGRIPSEGEVAKHLDIRPHIVGEVRRARAACTPASIDQFDFLLDHAVDIGYTYEPVVDRTYSERLRKMPDEWREIIYLHFHDRRAVDEIAVLTDLPDEIVIETIDLALHMLRGEST